VTKRQQRRWGAATTAVLAATALVVGGSPAPVAAAIPDVARQWATYMNRSLTVDATVAQLRTTLASQRTALSKQAATVTAARTATTAAQVRLTAASTAEAGARTRHTGAISVLATAKRTHAQVSKQKPRNGAAIIRAQRAVTAATVNVNGRKSQLDAAARVRKVARTEAQAATTAQAAAEAARQDADAAVRLTQQRITGAGTATGLAGQAAVLSKDVVTQVRARFKVADTTVIYGVTVHQSVAFAFKRMLEDAKADGIVLSGGGFRTKERQIELRKINGCPDIWTAPASSCRVPTAIPGRSLHELGLAVDMTYGGKSVAARTPAFTWLVANAAKYGYVNLPSEAWHWSITGG
jgi:zinc D-Ala-D-Ala carboxypeptidase